MNQNSLLYVPVHPQFPRANSKNPPGYKAPSDVGLKYENVTYQTADGIKIHGWLILQEKCSEERPTLYYFHGNAGNIGLRMPNYKELVHRCNVNVFAVDYRGYGESTGTPSERGLQLDAEAGFDYLMTRGDVIDPANVVIFGRSLGGAVAVHLASTLVENTTTNGGNSNGSSQRGFSQTHRRPVRALLLENTFTSVREMALQLFPVLNIARFLMSTLLENKWENAAKLGNISTPILFISGLLDQIVPPPHMQRLYHIARDASEKRAKGEMNDVKIETFPNAGHNDVPFINGKTTNIRYFEAIDDFLKKNCA